MAKETKKTTKIRRFLEENLVSLIHCPLSWCVIEDGVIASDGYFYEGIIFKDYYKKQRSSPMTRQCIENYHNLDISKFYLPFAKFNLDICKQKFYDGQFSNYAEVIIGEMEAARYDIVKKFNEYDLLHQNGGSNFCIRVFNLANTDNGFFESIRYILSNSDYKVKTGFGNILHVVLDSRNKILRNVVFNFVIERGDDLNKFNVKVFGSDLVDKIVNIGDINIINYLNHFDLSPNRIIEIMNSRVNDIVNFELCDIIVRKGYTINDSFVLELFAKKGNFEYIDKVVGEEMLDFDRFVNLLFYAIDHYNKKFIMKFNKYELVKRRKSHSTNIMLINAIFKINDIKCIKYIFDNSEINPGFVLDNLFANCSNEGVFNFVLSYLETKFHGKMIEERHFMIGIEGEDFKADFVFKVIADSSIVNFDLIKFFRILSRSGQKVERMMRMVDILREKKLFNSQCFEILVNCGYYDIIEKLSEVDNIELSVCNGDILGWMLKKGKINMIKKFGYFNLDNSLIFALFSNSSGDDKNIECLSYILAHCNYDYNVAENGKRNLLHGLFRYCCKVDVAKFVIDFLLNEKIDLNIYNTVDNEMQKPLDVLKGNYENFLPLMIELKKGNIFDGDDVDKWFYRAINNSNNNKAIEMLSLVDYDFIMKFPILIYNFIKKDNLVCLKYILKFRNLDVIQIAIDSIDDLTVDILDKNLLNYAIKYGGVDLIKFLIDETQNLEIPNVAGWKPLHVACCFGPAEVIEYLIAKNVSVWDHVEYGGNKCIAGNLVEMNRNINSRKREELSNILLSLYSLSD